ncbi:copper chaperone PCu(A)C [Corynebacterium mayonis]|uniref:copper chaperone PCu(A)C n=1 Tax=Corynebacterium mayonis TaxID=3062461 RepID=UPI0031402385
MISRTAFVALCAAAGLALTACSGEDKAETAESTASAMSATTVTESAAQTTTAAEQAVQGEGDIVLENGAVRAKTDPEMSMTAIFGTLRNTTDKDIIVTGFTSSLGAARYEMHETVDGVMRPIEGGFKVPAGATHDLAPGGDHLMILDYAEEIPAGETVDLVLETSTGDKIDIPGVAVRTMLPGHEDYGAHGEMMGHEMPHGATMENKGHEGH